MLPMWPANKVIRGRPRGHPWRHSHAPSLNQGPPPPRIQCPCSPHAWVGPGVVPISVYIELKKGGRQEVKNQSYFFKTT